MKTTLTVVGKLTIGLLGALLIADAANMATKHAIILVDEAKAAIYEVLPKKEVARRIKSIDESIAYAAKEHGVDPLILKVISEKESSGGNDRALYRFEPGLFPRLRKMQAYRSLSDSEVRMLASSHGVFHILGATAESECGLHFSKLYDHEVSANCAARIIRNIESNIKTKGASDRLREVFKRYNGQGPAADNYANDAMGRLAAILYQRVRG